jgi:hypothetical protein
MVALAQRLQTDARVGARLRAWRSRYDGGPVLLRILGRRVALILQPRDVARVLAESPGDFAPASREKVAALAHFEPDAVLISPDPQRGSRRPFNEAVLGSGAPPHHFAVDFAGKVGDEVQRLLARHAVIDWPALSRANARLTRRIVLGEAAADDDLLTDQLTTLRRAANWAWLGPRRQRLHSRFVDRLTAHLQRAEPGSLAAHIADLDGDPALCPYGQVPHWLFAFDAMGATIMRALAVLAGDPTMLARARSEVAGDALNPLQAWPYLRACVLETLRLWPTTLAILRDSTVPTNWHGRVMPAGTGVVIISSFFHRDPTRLPYADAFVPDIWLDGRADREPGLVPFSAGPVRCPGQELVLFTAATFLAAVLRGHTLSPVGPTLTPNRLPLTLNHAGLAVHAFRLPVRTKAAEVPAAAPLPVGVHA